MSKGTTTRRSILDHAIALASEVGLGGLTIGSLAEEMELSKSGLYAHFGSKEALQIQVLDHAALNFTEAVVRPALKEPRGAPRMRALFERWLAWDRDGVLPGGCLFVAAASELDDRDGPVRERLVELQQTWIDVLRVSVEKGIESGAFRRDADPAQFAQDLHGVMLGFHHGARLMRDPDAEPRARKAFERLLEAVAAVRQLP